METGKVVVERAGGKSTATHCFSKYPLKFIIPNKVGPSQADAVWIYTIIDGGGIVSACTLSISLHKEMCMVFGDSIKFDISVGDGCTTVLTTQASTKCSEQVLEIQLHAFQLQSILKLKYSKCFPAPACSLLIG
ncbi:urease accessory protein D-like isoform X3 [Coffea arabica]|uniref:Urease accessory protein D-like isoform X3 n=1 Tax=Coffea arabica TaxID=13443 RepID=A0ABM4VSP9_COFAR